MNDAAKIWVAALRSGDWTQCQNALRKQADGQYSFCCLGVACELSKLGNWLDDDGLFQDSTHIAMWKEEMKHFEESPPDDDYAEPPDAPKEEEFTSPDVQRWLGLREKDGTFVLDGEKTSLADQNDKGKTFSEIADIIEKYADQLFVPMGLNEYGPDISKP